MLSKNHLIALLAVLSLSPACMAHDDEEKDAWIMDTSEIGKSRNGIIRNDQILEMGVPTASALQLEGESSMRMGQLDRAIVALQRAIELAPLDPDKRLLYAEALEKKLMSQKQKDRDPRFYNFVVKQWLFILQKADFPDQKVQAGSHLVALTGTSPRMFEKPHKFLARVLLPEDGSKPVVLAGEKAPRKQVAHKQSDDDFGKEPRF
ncbi:MAG: tetratricopeptide repeat protein [Candidatus Obscuribacterales bacterium]|nr:tetratricopeptide repeat protein [Candidatus Obscuribacterales bacterium]